MLSRTAPPILTGFEKLVRCGGRRDADFPLAAQASGKSTTLLIKQE
jgi:hypothetical protein